MKIKVLLSHHAGKTGEKAVRIRVASGGSKKFFPAGISVRPADFDEKSGRVKTGRERAAEKNKIISDLVHEVETNYLTGSSPEPGNKKDLYWWFEKKIEQVNAKYTKRHGKKLTSVMTTLKAFRPRILLSSLDSSFIDDLELYLLKKNLHKNYIADIFTRIKTVVRMAMKGGAISYEKNPFTEFRPEKVRVVKKRLSVKDIQKLYKVQLKNELQARARDMFVFSYYCAGIRWGDLCRLKHSMIKNGRITFVRNKTKDELSVVLNKTALEIIKRQKTVGYIFTVGVVWANEEASIDARGTKYRKFLKAACRAAEIDEATFHTTRNSLIDELVRSGASSSVIKTAMGWKELATAEAYMLPDYQDQADVALNKVYKDGA